jgi:small-conductance mechanosensitive channel
LQEIAADLRRDPAFADDILAPLEMFGADQFADSAVVIKCPVKTQPIKPWRVGREMNRRIKKTFDAKGIEIPFSYQTIYWGEPKHGMPPPLIWRNWGRIHGLPADWLRSCVGGGIAYESRDR